MLPVTRDPKRDEGLERRPEEREPGTLEGFVQELIRRGTSLGLSSFFLTEEAVRRAFADKVPPEWIEYVSRQGEEVRADLADRLGKEFGNWLRTVDIPELVGELLERYDVSATIELSAARSRGDAEGGRGASLRVVARRK